MEINAKYMRKSFLVAAQNLLDQKDFHVIVLEVNNKYC